MCSPLPSRQGRALSSVLKRRSNCPRPQVEPCATVHGRFSTQNGIAQVIWRIGTTRKLDVANDVDGIFPSSVLRYLEMTSQDHSYIFGDFTVCPIEREKAGYMQPVCLADARNLVVQNIMNLWPPFRVPSTWGHRDE